MEPRFFKRGNKIFVVYRDGANLLQWNHVFSNVEIGQSELLGDSLADASMEPRFFKRGNPCAAISPKEKSASFNGTTFFQTWKCGRILMNDLNASMLQWNHVFSNVEIGGTSDDY